MSSPAPFSTILCCRQRAMNDPEVQAIMADPAMRMILEQMQSDPQVRKYSGYDTIDGIMNTSFSTYCFA